MAKRKGGSRSNAITVRGRALFVHLKEPRENEDTGKSTYELCILIPKKDKANVALVEDAIYEALEAEFGEEPRKWNNPLRDADDGDIRKSGFALSEDIEEAEGCYYINCSSKFFNWMEQLVDAKAKPARSADIIYPGCYVNVHLDAYAYDNQTKGVGLGLLAVQFVRDDEPISVGGGGVKAKNVFGSVDEEEEDEPRRPSKRRRDEEDEEEEDEPRRPTRRRRDEEDEEEEDEPRRPTRRRR